MKYQCPPLLLTIFNRPHETAKLFEVIKQVRPSRLFISADGPRLNFPDDVVGCRAARNVISVDWECEVWWHTRRRNLGTKLSLYDGISWFFRYVEEGIILQDDCLPDLSYFTFCNALLTKYRNDDRIFGISADGFLTNPKLPASYYFSRVIYVSCWAGWRRSWKLLDIHQTDWPELKQSDELNDPLQHRSVRAFEPRPWRNPCHAHRDTFSDAVIYSILKHGLLGISPATNLIVDDEFRHSNVFSAPENLGLVRIPSSPILFPLVHPDVVKPFVDFEGCVTKSLDFEESGDLTKIEHRKASISDPSMGDIFNNQECCTNVGEFVLYAVSTSLVVESLVHSSEVNNIEPETPASHFRKMVIHDPSAGELITRQIFPPAIFTMSADLACTTSVVESLITESTGEDDASESTLKTESITAYDPSMGHILDHLISCADRVDMTYVRPILGNMINEKVSSPPVVRNSRIGQSLPYLLSLDGEEFIGAAYAEILGRAPDPNGQRYYGLRLQHGIARIQILAELAGSGEATVAANWKRQLRWPYLLLKAWRMPVIGWVSELLCGFTRLHLRELLVRNDEQFVTCAFHAVLGRLPDPEGLEHYLGQLRGGFNKIAILSDLRSSSEGRAAGGRVAGLTTASWLHRLRKAPVVKSLIDVLTLPSVIINTLHRMRTVELSLYRHHEQQHSDVVNIRESVKEIHVSILALAQQLAKYADGTATLMDKESAAVSRQLSKVTSEMQTALSKTQADLAHKVQEAASLLGTSLPQTVAQASTAILAQLAKGETAQQQLRADLNQLNPQLGRIELYGMTAARRISVSCGSGAVLLRTNVGYVLCANEDHALIAALVESGELEPGTRHLIQRILSPGDVFIDVGANIGMHTLAAAQAMRGHGRVIAFEPYPPTARLLEQTVWMNGFTPVIDIHCVAATDDQRDRTLYLGATSGHHSLFPLDESFATDNASVKVQATTIDQITANVQVATLIKIDAEGAELEVLAGAAALVKRSKDVGIIAEFGNSHLKRTSGTAQEWLAHFSKLGFLCQGIHPDTGVLADISVDELNKVASITLFFARLNSTIWEKAKGKE